MKAAKKSASNRTGSPRDAWPARDTLDKFIKVVSGVIPLLDSVKESLEESTGSIPKASRQLDNVTKATESATVEILDLLEQMTARVDTLGSAIAGVRTAAEKREATCAAIDPLITQLKCCRPDLHARWNEFRAAGSGAGLPADLDAHVNDLRADVMNIGMALQVQDITTQQIAGVSHMIESIRMKLTEVLLAFNDDAQPGTVPGAHSDKADPNGRFNGDAEYSRTTDRQENADEIVERWKRGNHA